MKILILIIIFSLILLVGCKNKINQEQNYLNNLSYFDQELNITENVTFLQDITSFFLIDCSLPEFYENETVRIVYGNTIYNNSNAIKISFIEFCKRLSSE